MAIKRSAGDQIFDTFNYVFLAFLMVITWAFFVETINFLDTEVNFSK